MSTQWRMSVNGPTGLDYSAMYPLLDVYHVHDRETVVDDVRLMEESALEVIRERQRNG